MSLLVVLTLWIVAAVTGAAVLVFVADCTRILRGESPRYPLRMDAPAFVPSQRAVCELADDNLGWLPNLLLDSPASCPPPVVCSWTFGEDEEKPRGWSRNPNAGECHPGKTWDVPSVPGICMAGLKRVLAAETPSVHAEAPTAAENCPPPLPPAYPKDPTLRVNKRGDMVTLTGDFARCEIWAYALGDLLTYLGLGGVSVGTIRRQGTDRWNVTASCAHRETLMGAIRSFRNGQRAPVR